MNLSGIANLDPSGMVGRIYLENHSELLYAKYLSSGHHGFKKSNHKYTELQISKAWPVLTTWA